jgi:phosphoglucomutase/phosphomannomutase
MVIMDLEESGNYVAARPSGTEPKIKIYLFARLGPEDSIDLEAANAQLTRRLDTWDRELRALAKRYC